MFALHVLTQLKWQNEELAAVRTLVPLLHPMVTEFVDPLGPVAVEKLATHFTRVDTGAGVHGVDVAAQVELG